MCVAVPYGCTPSGRAQHDAASVCTSPAATHPHVVRLSRRSISFWDMIARFMGRTRKFVVANMNSSRNRDRVNLQRRGTGISGEIHKLMKTGRDNRRIIGLPSLEVVMDWGEASQQYYLPPSFPLFLPSQPDLTGQAQTYDEPLTPTWNSDLIKALMDTESIP